MNKILNVLRFGWPYLRRYWARLAVGVLFGILFGLSDAGLVWVTKTLVGRMAPDTAAPPEQRELQLKPDEAPNPWKVRLSEWKTQLDTTTQRWVDPWMPYAGRPVDWRQLLGGLLIFPALVAIRGTIGYLSSYCMAWVGEKVVNDLRTDVLRKLSGLSLDYFNRATMGDMLTHVNGDTALLQRCLRVGVSDLIKAPMTLIGVFLALCLIDWQLTLTALIFLPLCLAPVVVLGKKSRRAAKATTDVSITQSSLLVEILSGIRVVKAFGLEQNQVERFRRYSEQLVRHTMKTIRAKELINPIIETVSMIGFGLLIVYIAFTRRALEDMAGFLMGLVLFYNPVKRLAGMHILFEQTSVGVTRLMRILHEQPTVKESAMPKPLRAFKSEIVFDNVRFSYGHDLVLNDLHLRIPRGLKLGVAGESGSGKSTLVNLIFRFFDPTAGAVRIDGHDLREVSSADLRSLMALVSQDIVLFDMTVAENIALGRPGATREEIETAAQAAFAHDFVRQLPQGYDTRIGERGLTLSGGQRQRIAIARAFVRNAPILALDEATASLDSQSEAEVQTAIDRLAENRTVISVAHRLSTLTRMDLIIVLSRGQIVEQGTFDQLLQAQGLFCNMASRQGIAYSPNQAT